MYLGARMRSPVRLPGSGRVMDRRHALRCLARDPRDPFGGGALAASEMVPLPGLKAEIAAWAAGQAARGLCFNRPGRWRRRRRAGATGCCRAWSWRLCCQCTCWSQQLLLRQPRLPVMRLLSPMISAG